MKYVVRVTEQYRVDTEEEAKALIESAKRDHSFTLAKYSSEWKQVKQKGEVVDEWLRVILTKDFTSEKEPDKTTDISYKISYGSFPISDVDDDESEDEEE